jgi:hypothetical protein
MSAEQRRVCNTLQIMCNLNMRWLSDFMWINNSRNDKKKMDIA